MSPFRDATPVALALIASTIVATTGCRRLGLEIRASRMLRMAKVENASAVLADSDSRYTSPRSSITAWNPKTSRPFWSVPVPESGIDWDVAAERLVVAHRSSVLETYELASGKKASTFDVGLTVRSLCPLGDGKALLISEAERPTDADAKKAHTFDPMTGKHAPADTPCPPPPPEMPTTERTAKVGDATYRYDGKKLVATGKDGKEVWSHYANDVVDVVADDEVVVLDDDFVEVFDAKTGKSLGGILAQPRPHARAHTF